MTKAEVDGLAIAAFATVTIAKLLIGILLLAGGKNPGRERRARK